MHALPQPPLPPSKQVVVLEDASSLRDPGDSMHSPPSVSPGKHAIVPEDSGKPLTPGDGGSRSISASIFKRGDAAGLQRSDTLVSRATSSSTAAQQTHHGSFSMGLLRRQDTLSSTAPSSSPRAVPWYFTASNAIVSSTFFVYITGVFTVWVLICEDIRLLLSEKPADFAFGIIVILCFVAFAIELVLTSLGKTDYFGGFFFLLDVGALFSLLFDYPAIQERIAEMEAAQGLQDTARGRTARMGSRAARVVRIVRIIRVVKLYRLVIGEIEKHLERRRARPGSDDAWDDTSGGVHSDHRKQSRVGKKLTNLTIRRLVVIVLTMLFVVPALTPTGDQVHAASAGYGADEIFLAFEHLQAAGFANEQARLKYERTLLRFIYYHNPHKDNSQYSGSLFWVGFEGANKSLVRATAPKARIRPAVIADWERNVSTSSLYSSYYGSMPVPVQKAVSSLWATDCTNSRGFLRGISLLSEPAVVSYAVRCPSDLRSMEVSDFTPGLMSDLLAEPGLRFYFDIRPYNRQVAKWSIMLTSFMCLLLCVSTMLLSSDANYLVLYPLEDMIEKVEAIRAQPLKAVTMADAEFRAQEKVSDETPESSPLFRRLMCQKEGKGRGNQLMETMVLEKTIVKLGSLLALGLGRAGVNIIGQNMATGGVSNVDVMIAGQRVECIIGHARIPNFTVATEVLQSQIMTFVNQVAEIVHGIVDEFLGAANKNTGDTFLLLWVMEDPERDTRQADMSIVAFAKILGAVARSPKLADYRGHPNFQQRLGSNYRVELNLGLHAGWAIEGAVGSEFKIDASYISPNVAIAENVEHATKAYGVGLLASEKVVSLCHQESQRLCRVVDRVMIPGSTVPLELYCVDLDTSCLSVMEEPRCKRAWNPKNRYRVRQFLESEKKKKSQPAYQPGQAFAKESELRKMRERYKEEFLQLFKMGYKNYLEGEWNIAKSFLGRTKRDWGFEDGPSVALLRFMRKSDFAAPDDWQGVRELDCTHTAFPQTKFRHLSLLTSNGTRFSGEAQFRKSKIRDVSGSLPPPSSHKAHGPLQGFRPDVWKF